MNKIDNYLYETLYDADKNNFYYRIYTLDKKLVSQTEERFISDGIAKLAAIGDIFLQKTVKI